MRRLLLALSLLLVGFTPPQDTAPTYEVPSAPVLSIWSEEPSVSQYYWTAATGSADDWTIRVAGGDPSLAIVDDGGVQALRFRQTSNARAAASFDKLDNNADVEILTYVRTSTLGTSTQLAHWMRGSGSLTTNITGLISNKTSNTNTSMQLARYLDGAFASIVSTAPSPVSDVTAYHWRKTQLSGTTIRAKTWDGLVTDEPVDWQLSSEQSTVTASGWAGLLAFQAADNFYQIFSIGIGGASAPTGPFLPIFNSKVQNTLLRR